METLKQGDQPVIEQEGKKPNLINLSLLDNFSIAFF
jgi:hypothetical protein